MEGCEVMTRKGEELIHAVFGRAVFEGEFGGDIQSLLECHEGVEYSQEIDSVDEWYEYGRYVIEYKGRKFEMDYRDHVSDNVCDFTLNVDSFREQEADDTELLEHALRLLDMTKEEIKVSLFNRTISE